MKVKYLLISTCFLLCATGFYFYNKLDDQVTDACQAGILTMKHHMGEKRSIGLTEAFYKCASNSLDDKSSFFNPHWSVEELSCASGMGIAIHFFDEKHEWEQLHFLTSHEYLIYNLLDDCKQKIKVRRQRAIASQ